MTDRLNELARDMQRLTYAEMKQVADFIESAANQIINDEFGESAVKVADMGFDYFADLLLQWSAAQIDGGQNDD